MLPECRDCCWCGGSSGPRVGTPRRQKEDGSQCARGVGGTSHCCSSNIKPENPSREMGMIKAVQKCRCLSGFPGSVEASKHISLLVLPSSQPWGSRSRLLSGSQVPAPVCPQGQQVQQCRVEGTRWGCARRSSLHASVLQHSVKTLSVEVAADGFCQAMEPRSWCARGERVGEKANKTQRQCFSSYLFLRFICCHILGFSLFIWINVSDEV